MASKPTPEDAALASEIASRVRPGILWAEDIRATDWSQAEFIDRGKDHRVLVADTLVARLARGDNRGTQTQALGSDQRDLDVARVNRLVDQLAELLPWQLPVALTDNDSRGVIQPRIPGEAYPHGSGNQRALAEVVIEFEHASVDGLELAEPFTQRGGLTSSQASVLSERLAGDELAAQSLPLEALEDIIQATQDFTYRPDVAPGLVHGDLAGYNMFWRGDALQGIIDWDYAACWDTALNVAYLGLWHGLALIEDIAVDAHQAQRARIWLGALAVESLQHASTRGIPAKSWRRLLRKTAPRIHGAVDALKAQGRVR